MSVLDQPSRRNHRGWRRRSFVRAAIVVLGALVVFLLGMALARTLDDRPTAGRIVTRVRTLEPRPQEAPVRTVTVTVTGP